MKKSWNALLLAVFAILAVSILPVFADQSHVLDEADLFTSAQEEALEQKAQELSLTYDTNVFILTSNGQGYSSNYARDIIEDYGERTYPEGYIGFMIDMLDRSYWVDAYGRREREIFTQSYTDKMAESTVDALSAGDYYQAADTFLDTVEKRLIIKTTPFGFLQKLWLYPLWTIATAGAALILALLAAFGVTAWKASGHRDKKLAVSADGYNGDLNLTRNTDQFVRMYQTRIRRQESSGHGGGGGGGGGGGHTGSGGHF